MSAFDSPNAPSFIGAAREIIESAVCLFGVPYDSTTSFRPGTRNGPDALRMVSDGLEDYSPEQDLDLGDIDYCDIGNLSFPLGSPGPVLEQIYAGTREILQGGGIPLMLGGEHSISPPAVKAVWEKHPDLVLVQIDAHADLRTDYMGEPNSHACAIRRCLDFMAADAVLQVGIRSGTKLEWDEMRKTNRYVEPKPEVFAKRLEAFRGRPIYLTIDLDVFDPGYFPGTGTPEPGGINWQTFAGLLKAFEGFQIVAADAVELSPALDPTGVSSVLAAKVVRELILRLTP